uniref:Uncharacterized protein n=1 Tax=Globisporangium ultimum (strain ATCC 200006 / CBS 805.95 / DAOM BR144) TaxID=431595 RepID=K3W5N0_GLOUD
MAHYDINAGVICSSTGVSVVDRSKDGTLLTTGDDFVKVFRYPCVLEKASSVELRGHASHVANVRWSPHDHFIISVRGNDRCVFAWQHEKPGNKAVEIDPYKDDDFTPQHAVGGNQDARANRDSDPLEMTSAFDNVGDGFVAMKPWLCAVVAPSSASEMNLKSTPPMHIWNWNQFTGIKLKTRLTMLAMTVMGKPSITVRRWESYTTRVHNASRFSRATMTTSLGHPRIQMETGTLTIDPVLLTK